MDTERLECAEAILGHRFADRSLLDIALTHPSYAAEHGGVGTYERLEFLGDAVLGFLISDELYRALPDAPEGELTQRKHHAISGSALAATADELGLADVVLLGRGATATGERRRASILENVLEAVIGALYLDGGLEAATDFALRVLGDRLIGPGARAVDPKSALQQLTQATGRGLPTYRVASASGPPHLRCFTVEVLVDGELAGRGSGSSKQAAEKAAASDALGPDDGSDRGGAVTP